MKKNIIYTILFLCFITLISCDDEEGYEEYEIAKTELQDLSGDWFVTLTVNGEDVFGLGYQKITTSNTAANAENKLLIDDHINTYWFKVVADANVDNKTFSGDALPSSVDDDDDPDTPDYEVDVTITNGKVLYDATMSSAGNVTDSIYFEAEFSDDPGTVYEIAGHKRTGFLEDEH